MSSLLQCPLLVTRIQYVSCDPRFFDCSAFANDLASFLVTAVLKGSSTSRMVSGAYYAFSLTKPIEYNHFVDQSVLLTRSLNRLYVSTLEFRSPRCRLSRNVPSVKERQLYLPAKLSSANVNVHYVYVLVVLASCDLHVLFASQPRTGLRQCPTKSKLRF